VDRSGPFRHIGAYTELTRALLEEPRGEGTDLRKSLMPHLEGISRPLTVLVITDGFQRESLVGLASAVASFDRHRLVFLLTEDPRDRRPPLKGNLLLRDAEGPGSSALLSDGRLEEELHRRIDDHFSELRSGLVRHGAEILHIPVGEPFEESFLDVLRRSYPANLPPPVS
jgi:hypothetical protein